MTSNSTLLYISNTYSPEDSGYRNLTLHNDEQLNENSYLEKYLPDNFRNRCSLTNDLRHPIREIIQLTESIIYL